MTLFNLAVVKKMITMQEKAWPMRPKVIDIFQTNEIKILYSFSLPYRLEPVFIYLSIEISQLGNFYNIMEVQYNLKVFTFSSKL